MTDIDTTAMKPSQIAKALELLIHTQQPGFVWGPPGVGKSALARQAANACDIELRDVRAVLLDPVDLRGLPHVNGEGRAHWASPDFLPRDGEGVLFLDELNAAPPLVQAACYQLILDRCIGEYRLPDGWTVLAAGNRDTDRAVTSRMPTALANRFIHMSMVPDVDEWTQWAIQEDIATEIIAFMRFRPELLHMFDPKSASKAFPTPRSWEFAARIVEADPDPEVEFQLLAGTVGEGAAVELMGFLKVFRNLPSPDLILMDPEHAAVPDKPEVLYALTGALSRKANEDNGDRVITYAERLPAEFNVVLVRDTVQRVPELTNTRRFIQWAADNSNVIL
jgi:hypothetical protein